MSWSYRGFDHPEAAQRALRAFDAGLDTARIAEILRADEHEVAQVLSEERDARRRRARAHKKRFEALLAAWTANDVDRAAVAQRFGYRDRGSARRCLYGYRQRAARTTPIRQDGSVGEGDADQVLCTTHDLAGVGSAIRPDRKPKLIWHLYRGANLDQCARKRRIANEAITGFRAFASPDFADPEDEGTQSNSTIEVRSGPRLLRRAIMQASLFKGAYLDLARDRISRSDFNF